MVFLESHQYVHHLSCVSIHRSVDPQHRDIQRIAKGYQMSMAILRGLRLLSDSCRAHSHQYRYHVGGSGTESSDCQRLPLAADNWFAEHLLR